MKNIDTEREKTVPSGPARIEYLRVENYRSLRNVELKGITPLTVLLGPNGSGKSTVFDVFNFLSECLQSSLRQAWDRRGRAKELRTRGQTGPITIEVKYRERPRSPLITYHLSVDPGSEDVMQAAPFDSWIIRRGRDGRSAATSLMRQRSGWIPLSVPPI